MNSSVVRLAIILALSPPVFAQSRPTYIQFSPGAVKGALYKPDSGSADVAILIIPPHRLRARHSYSA